MGIDVDLYSTYQAIASMSNASDEHQPSHNTPATCHLPHSTKDQTSLRMGPSDDVTLCGLCLKSELFSRSRLLFVLTSYHPSTNVIHRATNIPIHPSWGTHPIPALSSPGTAQSELIVRYYGKTGNRTDKPGRSGSCVQCECPCTRLDYQLRGICNVKDHIHMYLLYRQSRPSFPKAPVHQPGQRMANA